MITTTLMAMFLSLMSQQPVDCSHGGETQREMNICAERAATTAGEKLARLLDELSDALDASQASALRDLQRDWDRVVKNDCRWEQSLFVGGSVSPMVYASCLAANRNQRIERFKLFLCEGAGRTGECGASRKYDSP